MDIIQQKETINKKESNMYYKNPTIEDLFENLRNNIIFDVLILDMKKISL